MDHHLTLRVISLIHDMVLINSVIEIDYIPPTSKSTEIYLTALMTLIAAKNMSMPFPGPTLGPKPKEIQKYVIDPCDMHVNAPRDVVAPPRRAKCSICLQHILTRPFEIHCGHVFCRQCALVTFSQLTECPVCSAIPEPLHEPEAKPSTEPAVDVAYELRTAKIIFISWAWATSILVLYYLFLDLYPAPDAGDWKTAYHYVTAFFALYPIVKDLARSLIRCTWWSMPLVLGLTSICTMAATYDSAARYMDRTGVFWTWWSLPLTLWCTMVCVTLALRSLVSRYATREKADMMWL